ncbi:hypothetical protein G0U57_014457, partial [Chelydra serpentina]
QFGLAAVPKNFVKVFSVVAAQMRYNDYTVFLYLDNWLLTGRSYLEVVSNLVLGNVPQHGEVYSDSQASHKLHRSTPGLRHSEGLPPSRQIPYQEQSDQNKSLKPRTAVQVHLFLLSHMASCTYIIPFTRLHLHCLQAWLMARYTSADIAQTP